MKKILKITAIVLLLLIGAAFAIPLLFKGKILTLVKDQANRNLNARVDFADADLSLFRHFPRLAVALDSLRVTGIDEFSGDTLVSARRIDVALNLLSVISGKNMKIHSISVEDPRIHAIVHKNGKVNWSITKPDTATAEPGNPAASQPFRMQLEKYAITNAYISYLDEAGNMSCEIRGLDHGGSGDFSSDLFTLSTKTHIAGMNVTYAGIPYFVNTQTLLDADFKVDNKTHTYSFKTDRLGLNELVLSTEGFFQLVNDSTYNMDIRFRAPSTDFRNLLSLVPAVYKKDFATLKTSGQAIFAGFVKGVYDGRQLPAYHIDLSVKNGFFQYPDLPRPVKNINITASVDNPDGVTDHTVTDLSAGHIEMDASPFDFRLLLKTPISDPYIDAAAKGSLDLGKLSQLVKLESGTSLAGLLKADAMVRGHLSAIEKSAKPAKGAPGVSSSEGFSASGSLDLSQFRYTSPAYPGGIGLDRMLLTFNPKNVILNELSGAYLGTHFNADGQINNLLGYALKNRPLDGSLNLKADRVNLDDWMGMAAADSNARTTGVPGNRSDTTEAGGRHAATAGKAAPAPVPPFAVPANISFLVKAAVGSVRYDRLDLRNLTGTLRIADETVELMNVRADALDGSLTVNGSYSTKEDKKKPAIALQYDVKNLDIQQTFLAFNTVQKLMPAGKFMAGKLNSQLTLNGRLGDNMMPDLNSLNGEGNLLVLEGMLRKFEPLDKLARTIQVDQLKDIVIRDIKTYFSFRNGKVVVNPFKVKVKDIDMEIGGAHGFDQSLDYAIRLKLPRSLLGGSANTLVNNVLGQINAKGIPLKAGESINLDVKMGGTLTNPTIGTDLAGALAGATGGLKQQAADLVQAKVDSAKNQLRDTARSLQKQAIKDAGDELKKQLPGGKKDTGARAPGGLDNSRKKAEDASKGLLNNLLKKKP